MYCPKCIKAGNAGAKLKVVDSRSVGPFEQQRKYVCPECGYEKYNIEQLDIKEKEVNCHE